jgi:glutathione synthase
LHLGGTALQCSLTKYEKKICDALKPYLTKNNLFLVGIDLIDNKLTEINVTSPTGLIQIKDVSKIDISKIIWDKLL